MSTMVSRTGRAMPGVSQRISRMSWSIVAPTMTRIGAVASGGMTPASGERKRQSRKSRPVTTEARPVRPPSSTPAELSMNVVFDEAEAAPPGAPPPPPPGRPLDKGGFRRSGGGAPGGRAPPVEERAALQAGRAPPPVAQPGPPGQPEHRARRVEEVREQHGEHDRDRA